jgi:hypothetical protein
MVEYRRKNIESHKGVQDMRHGHTTLSAIAALGVLALSGCSLFDSDPPRDPDTGELLEPTELNVFDLEVGDCLDEFSEGTDVSTVDAVPCDVSHTEEVYFSTQMPDGDYPGLEEARAFAEQQCAEGFAEFVGIPWEDSELDFGYFNPTEASWSEGDREVLCTITDPLSAITGSLASVNR